ncbi:MAG: hypothetical protein H6865_00255 [Rhodospirillales bacterium]|nr:hypothetical protein [Rhodospirillales bacterium]
MAAEPFSWRVVSARRNAGAVSDRDAAYQADSFGLFRSFGRRRIKQHGLESYFTRRQGGVRAGRDIARLETLVESAAEIVVAPRHPVLEVSCHFQRVAVQAQAMINTLDVDYVLFPMGLEYPARKTMYWAMDQLVHPAVVTRRTGFTPL